MTIQEGLRACTIETITGGVRKTYRNPDGPEAAALLDKAERVVDAAYHCEQARTYIAEPAANTSEKNMTSARWHLDKALTKLRKEKG